MDNKETTVNAALPNNLVNASLQNPNNYARTDMCPFEGMPGGCLLLNDITHMSIFKHSGNNNMNTKLSQCPFMYNVGGCQYINNPTHTKMYSHGFQGLPILQYPQQYTDKIGRAHV